MQGENKPEKEVQRYADLLNNELVIVNGFPQFDLLLLGMGDDGHTASIFPNAMQLLTIDASVVSAKHPTSNQNRITLTGNVIKNATKVVFLVTGVSKASVLKQIVNNDSESNLYPAYFFSKLPVTEFYLDISAAREIK